MKEEDSISDWLSKWEDELPSPEDLIPISQSLITPDLALAFNIPSPHKTQTPPRPPLVSPSQHNSSAEFDSPEVSAVAPGPSGGSGSDELARTLKRPRLVWTPQLHKRFVDAVAHLGIKNAVPKTIMQLMSVDGLTRENVASHLQKYRLYLKRMQGISSSGGAPATGMDPATDHLFASSPVPPHFLHPNGGNSDHFMPFVPVATPHHLHHQMRVVPPSPNQFRPFGNGSPPNGQFEHPFLRHSQSPAHVPRISSTGTTALVQQHHGNGNGPARPPPYIEDLEPTNRRKVLTLFPTGDDDS